MTPCSSSGGMTKTFGICTEAKEEGGAARPGESKERKVSMAKSRGEGGTKRWFNKCSTDDLPYSYNPISAPIIDYDPHGQSAQ